MNGLELKNVQVTRGKFHLRDISLAIPQGSVLGLVGKSGAGKTTLIRTIANCKARDSGVILYDGLKLWEHEEEVKRKIGVVFDEVHFNDQLKPKQIMKVLSKIYDVDQKLYESGMSELTLDPNQLLCKYSMGMKRKISIILALCCKPSILLLDEPTSNIDPADRISILNLLRNFMKDKTHTILFSTHITSDLETMADSIAMLDDGKLLLCEDKKELLETYLLVEASAEQATPELRQQLIGIKQTQTGITGLTRELSLRDQPNLNCKAPKIGDLLYYLTGKELAE